MGTRPSPCAPSRPLALSHIHHCRASAAGLVCAKTGRKSSAPFPWRGASEGDATSFHSTPACTSSRCSSPIPNQTKLEGFTAFSSRTDRQRIELRSVGWGCGFLPRDGGHGGAACCCQGGGGGAGAAAVSSGLCCWVCVHVWGHGAGRIQWRQCVVGCASGPNCVFSPQVCVVTSLNSPVIWGAI
jgi:hypothetical protein